MKVLLIEDNPEIVNGVTLTFKLRWPEVTVISAEEGNDGIKKVQNDLPDIVILDINLPDINGFEVLRQVRLFSNVPIIILTVRRDEVDQLQGLEMGADDYILKPFSPANLLSRVKAVMRRSQRQELGKIEPNTLTFGNITLDFSNQEVFSGSVRVHLTATETKILFCLAKNGGKLQPQEVIMNEVWGPDARYIDNSTLKRYVYQLRSKLEDKTENNHVIVNERGLGYRLVTSSEMMDNS